MKVEKNSNKAKKVKERKVIKRKVIAENLPIIFTAEMQPVEEED